MIQSLYTRLTYHGVTGCACEFLIINKLIITKLEKILNTIAWGVEKEAYCLLKFLISFKDNKIVSKPSSTLYAEFILIIVDQYCSFKKAWAETENKI